MKDTACTTALARVAAKALRQLQNDQEIREDKVAQFKHLGSDDTDISSDAALDAIFSRLFAT